MRSHLSLFPLLFSFLQSIQAQYFYFIECTGGNGGIAYKLDLIDGIQQITVTTTRDLKFLLAFQGLVENTDIMPTWVVDNNLVGMSSWIKYGEQPNLYRTYFLDQPSCGDPLYDAPSGVLAFEVTDFELSGSDETTVSGSINIVYIEKCNESVERYLKASQQSVSHKIFFKDNEVKSLTEWDTFHIQIVPLLAIYGECYPKITFLLNGKKVDERFIPSESGLVPFFADISFPDDSKMEYSTSLTIFSSLSESLIPHFLDISTRQDDSFVSREKECEITYRSGPNKPRICDEETEIFFQSVKECRLNDSPKVYSTPEQMGKPQYSVCFCPPIPTFVLSFDIETTELHISFEDESFFEQAQTFSKCLYLYELSLNESLKSSSTLNSLDSPFLDLSSFPSGSYSAVLTISLSNSNISSRSDSVSVKIVSEKSESESESEKSESNSSITVLLICVLIPVFAVILVIGIVLFVVFRQRRREKFDDERSITMTVFDTTEVDETSFQI